MSDLPEVILPEARDINVNPWRRRKPRYYSTPYWPCPFYNVRLRYIYFSSKTHIELAERAISQSVSAVMKPLGWSLVVGFRRKRNPVPESLRHILCVYVDARHVGHVEYVSEEVMTVGELASRADVLEELGVDASILPTLIRRIVTGWKKNVSDETGVKVVRFRWLDSNTAVALGFMKNVRTDELSTTIL